MAVLSAEQRTTLNTLTGAEGDTAFTRDGTTAFPNFARLSADDLRTLRAAACWSWALYGAYVDVNRRYGPQDIYSNLITLNANTNPVSPAGVDMNYANTMAEAHPAAAEYITSVSENINQAIAALRNNPPRNDGRRWIYPADTASQRAVREALMKIAIVCAGMEIAAPGNAAYQIHMRCSTWWSWDHWGVSIAGPAGQVPVERDGATNDENVARNVLQKVPDARNTASGDLTVRSYVMWDEGLTETVVPVTALQDAHVRTLFG